MTRDEIARAAGDSRSRPAGHQPRLDCLLEMIRIPENDANSSRSVKPAFEADTAFEALGDHRFAATVTNRWNGIHGRPLGGYVLAAALQPLRSIQPFPDLLVTSAFFLAPVVPGPVEVRTEVARVGRHTATGQARLFQDGKEALRATATFTELSMRPDRKTFSAAPPLLPEPAESIDLLAGDPVPASSVADRVDYRVAETPGWRQGRPNGEPSAELWVRLTEGGGEDTLTLPLLADVAAPAVMELGATGSTTLELTVHVRARPAQGWQACRATTRFVVDGYHEEDFELWDNAGHIVAQARQLAIIRV